MIDAMTCTELPAAIAMEDGQTECTFECNYCRKRTSLARRSEPNQTNLRLAKVSPRENSLVILSSKLPMLQQEAESSRMSMLAKVSLRENSQVFFGAELPMLQQVIKNVNDDHNFSGTDKFFNHRAVGWFVG